MSFNYNDFTLKDISEIVGERIDAVVVADGNADEYKSVIRRGIFEEYLEEAGSYHDLIEKLVFHLNNSSDNVIDDYHVFVPSYGIFIGKYSKKININHRNMNHVVQMTIYPLESDNTYLFLLDELDKSQYIEESLTTKKVTTIQNTYLFSMYADIVKDTINSISLTEVSDDVMNQQLKYSGWRMMIVNMIGVDYQSLFLEKTDPEYLKNNLNPGNSFSFDCLMKNLEGNYIWVRLTFSRAETNNACDFRFVFMVQDINESYVQLMSTLKDYEELASKDTLTSIFNHGRIETEINNAIDAKKTNNEDIALMMLDIDFFKHVNDEHGHSVGDKTLVHFVRIIREFLQKQNAVMGRWGGEEFVVVLYGISSDDCLKIADSLRKKVAGEPFEVVGNITCSIGVTSVRQDDEFDSAFNRIDKALYEAKSAGRNCIKSQ